jgi:transposase
VVIGAGSYLDISQQTKRRRWQHLIHWNKRISEDAFAYIRPRLRNCCPLYAAVDLHGDNGYYCIINDHDQVVYQMRLPNTLAVVLRELEPYRRALIRGIAVESTYNWYWVAGAEAILMGQANLRIIDALNREIASLEKAAEGAVKFLPDYQVVLTVPGIGRILSMIIMLETGPISRFASAGHYTSYCCCAKAEAISNGQKKAENNRKCGNRYLAWAFIEAANFAVRYCKPMKRWYQRKLARSGGSNPFIVHVAWRDAG